jgi:Alcohol dehydrogenase transcription factor Myb/SANT-like.
MSKLSERFEGKFTVSELKTCWHNTVTTYKREKQREEGSKASAKVYYSSWEFYNMMDFVDITCNMDENVSSLEDHENQPPTKKKKVPKISEEQTAKANLWRALTNSITQKSNNGQQQQSPAKKE